MVIVLEALPQLQQQQLLQDQVNIYRYPRNMTHSRCTNSWNPAN